jgi:hypothetical protein
MKITSTIKLSLWVVAFVLTCAMVWAGHSFTPPPIPVFKHPHKSAAVHQGAGASKLIAKIVLVPTLRTNSIPWLYPPGVVASAFWWDIQQAAAPTGPWTVLVTNASGAFDVHVNKYESLRIYRLSAKVHP